LFGLSPEKVNELRSMIGLGAMEPPLLANKQPNPAFVPTPHWVVEGYSLFKEKFLQALEKGAVTKQSYSAWKGTLAPSKGTTKQSQTADARRKYADLQVRWAAFKASHKGVPLVANPNTTPQKEYLEFWRKTKTEIPRGFPNFLPKLGKTPPQKKSKTPQKGKKVPPPKRTTRTGKAPNSTGSPFDSMLPMLKFMKEMASVFAVFK